MWHNVVKKHKSFKNQLCTLSTLTKRNGMGMMFLNGDFIQTWLGQLPLMIKDHKSSHHLY